MRNENVNEPQNQQFCQNAVSRSVIGKQVVVMEWGEPCIKNIIDVNYGTNKVQLQTEGHFGSYWTDFKNCMAQYQIDYFYIQKASYEVNRLQIKRTVLESRLLTDG